MPSFSRRAILLAAAALGLIPAAARAHAILEDSTPPSGGKIAAGAATLTFRFNSRIDRGRSRLTLTRTQAGADQVRTVLTIDPDGPPDILTAHVTLSPGAYVARWLVLAVDGHITRGDVPFTVEGN